MLCGPDAGGTIMTFGPLVLDNRGNGTVTIQRVSFYGDDHLRLLRAVILPIRGSLIGVDYGWPPPRDVLADSEARWSQAVPAARAAIPPHLHVPDQRNLVIEMRPMAYRSVFAGVQVLYKEFGKQYELRTRTRTDIYIAKAVPAHC